MTNKIKRKQVVNVNFTTKVIQYIHNKIRYVNRGKYLGITLDAKLRWKACRKSKKTPLQI